MLPLAGSALPSSPEALREALKKGLMAHSVSAHSIAASGGEWPQLDDLTLDLTGAQVTRDTKLPVAKGAESSGIEVAKFQLQADPMRLEKTPARLFLKAANATLNFVKGKGAESALTLTAAKHGEIEIEVEKADLEELIRSIASEAAAKHGVEIKRTALTLAAHGSRALSFRAEVGAKMFVMSTTVTVSGEAEIDDKLNARVSKLTCSGDGMIGSLASGFIRPYFDQIESRPIPLMALSLGSIKLRDISVEAGKALTLRAKFSS
jgi:hypothetical protein